MSKKRPQRIALDLGGLIGRVDIFRLTVGKKRDSAIDTWLAGDPVELRAIARKWFGEMRRCGVDVRELMHDGCPVACVDDVPFASVASFKNHVNVGFFYGAMLADPVGLLEGSGKRMRHVKLKPDSKFDTEALRTLIDAAYADVKARLSTERASRT